MDNRPRILKTHDRKMATDRNNRNRSRGKIRGNTPNQQRLYTRKQILKLVETNIPPLRDSLDY